MKREGLTMRLRQAAIAALVMLLPAAANAAQTCDARAFGVQIDQTAQALRTLNRDSETRFHERLQALGKLHGWTEAQTADKAAAAMDDGKLENFNTEIEELVAQLDALSATPNNQISCARLSELKSVQAKLVAVMGQKSGFILAQLEVEGTRPAAAPYAQPPLNIAKSDRLSPATESTEQPKAAEQPKNEQTASADQPWSVNIARTPQPAPQQSSQRWAAAPSAKTTNSLQFRPEPAAPKSGDRIAALTPAPSDLSAPPPVPAGYTEEEIREAGKGLFGSLTSEFAILINHSFKTFGMPNAYIVGDEGGGAFLAGLRYGDGKLFTRLNGAESTPTPIYWQGPSLGADIGATGSHTLFLVYNLDGVSTLYRRFPGIDGAAYVAGGLGMTVYKSGDTLIIPIRTGLGLRLGASIAYLKFTQRASLNPF
ncbi:MAG: EipA family protein [Rhodomicrobium sp.]